MKCQHGSSKICGNWMIGAIGERKKMGWERSGSVSIEEGDGIGEHV